jgi:sporulation protein YlmC with PRC-barrel domain
MPEARPPGKIRAPVLGCSLPRAGRTEVTMSLSFAEKISGRTALDASGQVVGTVDDLSVVSVEDGSWRVASFRLRLRREIARDIGAASPLLRSAVVDIPAEMVQAIGDAVILSAPTAALHDLVTERQRATNGSESPAPPNDPH